MTGYRVHDHFGQAWVEVPTSQIQELGLAGKLSSLSRISPDGEAVYVHEREDFQRLVEALGVPPEKIDLDEDVVLRSAVGEFPPYSGPDNDEKSS